MTVESLHPVCGQPDLLLRVADPVSCDGFPDGLLCVGGLHVADQCGGGRALLWVQREVAVVIAGRGSPSETHTLGLYWDWRLMKR
jgi:hypothetical protein